MATEAEEQPYDWLSNVPPPSPDVFQLWTDVANGPDTKNPKNGLYTKNPKIFWTAAVKSLENASKFLQSSQAARLFVEKNMEMIVDILLHLDPCKLGPYERDCVMDSVKKAVDIMALDLDIQIRRNGECRLLSSLAIVLNKTLPFYEGINSDERLKMLHHFRQSHGGGFRLLCTYLMQKIGQSSFPKSEYLNHILSAVADALLVPSMMEEVEADVISMGNTVVQAINLMTDGQLSKFAPGMHLLALMQDLQCLFDRLLTTRPDKTYEYYAFWRALVLRLVTSEHFPFGKVVGWTMVKDLIQACANHLPPCSFVVANAGCTFVNGQYDYAGPFTEDGIAKWPNGHDSIRYVRTIPDGEEHAGHELTLFRCVMRSHQKWWFISEAHEEQPGTDHDVDYYQHKCKDLDDVQAAIPPPSNWLTCRTAGVDPAPLLEASKECMPLDKVSQTVSETLGELLAKWAIDNSIMEKLPCSNGISAMEVAEYSTALCKFLAHTYCTANGARSQDRTNSASSIADSNIVDGGDDDDMTE